MGSLGRSGGGGGGPSRDDDSEEDEDSDDDKGKAENWFAGGERRYFLSHSTRELVSYTRFSGISVENPDSQRSVPGGAMVRDILRRAAQYVRSDT